jgi:hypothetical protein
MEEAFEDDSEEPPLLVPLFVIDVEEEQDFKCLNKAFSFCF